MAKGTEKITTALVSKTQIAKSGMRTMFAVTVAGKKTGYIEERQGVGGKEHSAFTLGTNKRIAIDRFNNPGPELPFMKPCLPKAPMKVNPFPQSHTGARRKSSSKKELTIGESAIGTLRFFDHQKGYGYIEVPGYADAFVCHVGVPEEFEPQLQTGILIHLTMVKSDKTGRAMACITSIQEHSEAA